MNKLTISRAIVWSMGHVLGQAGWVIAGAYGRALAEIELGNMQAAAWNYTQAKRYLRVALRCGDYR